MEERKVHIVVVTGLSGSGKSTAIKAFEDLDYFCIDNLPVPLLPTFLDLCKRDMPNIQKIALGIDIRGRAFLKDYERIFMELQDAGYLFEMLFFEASTEVLQRRYSQTRRVHPIGNEEPMLLGSIEKEREELRVLRSMATRIVDTGTMTVHQLKAHITRIYAAVSEKELLSIQILSFGFKYGLPFEADIVMDVRFLPNPYFVEDLKDLTGTTSKVQSWILQWPETIEFLDDYTSLILKLLPSYMQEGKRYLTLATGCTGGKHRSVVVASRMAERLSLHGYFVNLFHRDIHRE